MYLGVFWGVHIWGCLSGPLHHQIHLSLVTLCLLVWAAQNAIITRRYTLVCIWAYSRGVHIWGHLSGPLHHKTRLSLVILCLLSSMCPAQNATTS